MTTTPCTGCAVQQGTHQPAEALHQKIEEPAASVEKQIDEVMQLVLGWQIKSDIAGDAAIDAFDPECSAEDDAFANKCHEEQLEAWEAIRSKLRTLLSTPQPCSRSHPHEEMTPMCELRTEIARLTNALARSEAQLAAAPQAVPGVGALYALQEAEAALELAIHRILKRDPGHAVHVTSEAKALVAVRAALDTAAPAHPAEGVHAAVIAGAIFDFAGYLTTLPHEKALHCSEAHEASPMVEAITEWCKRRGLRTDGARVETWRAALAAQAKQGGA